MTDDTKFLDEQRAKLEEERTVLEQELGSIAKKGRRQPGEFDARFPDYGRKEEENADEVAAFEARISIERDLDQHYQDVKAALSRIEKGTYGVCPTCGKEIRKERLRIAPAAIACMDCATS